jgi:hypothetical protein
MKCEGTKEKIERTREIEEAKEIKSMQENK